MTLVVQKYGGTSVADLDRIRNVAARVKRHVDGGEQVAVVVSAMAGSTNRLVGWVHGLDAAGYDTAEYDQVVASGEQVTVGLLAIDRRVWNGKSAATAVWRAHKLQLGPASRAEPECIIDLRAAGKAAWWQDQINRAAGQPPQRRRPHKRSDGQLPVIAEVGSPTLTSKQSIVPFDSTYIYSRCHNRPTESAAEQGENIPEDVELPPATLEPRA